PSVRRHARADRRRLQPCVTPPPVGGGRDLSAISHGGQTMTAAIRNYVRWLLAIALVVTAQARGRASDWPGGGGPTGLGYCDAKDLPLTWNAKTGDNIRWKSLLHGGAKNNPDFTSPGWSSPIVWRDRIFLTTAVWPMNLSDKERRAVIAEHHVL